MLPENHTPAPASSFESSIHPSTNAASLAFVLWVWAAQEDDVSSMPFSSVTATCASPVVVDSMRKGTPAMRRWESSSALTRERSPRKTWSDGEAPSTDASLPASRTRAVPTQSLLTR